MSQLETQPGCDMPISSLRGGATCPQIQKPQLTCYSVWVRCTEFWASVNFIIEIVVSIIGSGPARNSFRSLFLGKKCLCYMTGVLVTTGRVSIPLRYFLPSCTWFSWRKFYLKGSINIPPKSSYFQNKFCGSDRIFLCAWGYGGFTVRLRDVCSAVFPSYVRNMKCGGL